VDFHPNLGTLIMVPDTSLTKILNHISKLKWFKVLALNFRQLNFRPLNPNRIKVLTKF
jgi:hypothetical protein